MDSNHLVVVEKLSDFRWNDADIEITTAEAFISGGSRIRKRPGKVINLCRSYSYLSIGYYCSLLAEARGDRVTPSVETILDLQRKKLQAVSLPSLNRLVGPLKEVPKSVKSLTLHVFFGEIEDPQLAALARRSFEIFRCPLLEIELERLETSDGWQVSALHPLEPRDVGPERDAALLRGLSKFTRRAWKPVARPRTYRMDLAILHDPKDPLPPSSLDTLQHIADIAESMDISVELIEKKDLSRLTQFDALFIRETTAVSHHTFQFARMAQSEGMPVIDDPTSILRCTNKAFLAELLKENGVATPRTHMLSRQSMAGFGAELAFPVVLKVPDGAFSRSVKKAEDAQQLQAIAQEMLKESDVILVQEFMYTPFDWRIGILDGRPLFAARYHMCRDHWQIIQHSSDGQSVEGHVDAILLDEVPPAVLRAACRSASLVGDGFYGVDIKVHEGRPFVIEINDNPNLDAGVEDAREGDNVYRKILRTLLERFESRRDLPKVQGAGAAKLVAPGPGAGGSPPQRIGAPAAQAVAHAPGRTPLHSASKGVVPLFGAA
ncbi:RimK family protein [Xylophilus sp. ASV27]|uniref:RimK family protein n=1 Tax=Xylophilus sp. ASV27 TaxID=2795129 RepID=UPI0018EB8EBA